MLTRWRTPKLPPPPGPLRGRIEGPEPVLRLGVFGESPAAGIGASRQERAVGARLAGELARLAGRGVAWRVLAGDGWTARELLGRLDEADDHAPLDLALLALGVNDTLRMRRPSTWIDDIGTLLEAIARRHEAPRVLLAGPPDIGHFPALKPPLSWVLGLKARELDGALAAFAAARPGCQYLPTRLDRDSARLFAADGFHPSDEGHRVWAEALAGPALALLSEAG